MKRRFREENLKTFRKINKNALCINNRRSNQHSIVNLFYDSDQKT